MIKRILTGFLILIAVILLLSLWMGTPTKVSPDDLHHFKGDVQRVVGRMPAAWHDIVIDNLTSLSVGATLIYAAPPADFHQVQADTHKIARAILKVLQDKGKSPHQDMITVHVHAQLPIRGETGAAMTRYFGKTMYDYNDDRLVFKPARD